MAMIKNMYFVNLRVWINAHYYRKPKSNPESGKLFVVAHPFVFTY